MHICSENALFISDPPSPLMKAIMVQATTSGAGKSTLVAAICSALRHDGYSVAPFKTQNMSLNSYVAAIGGTNNEGGEMAVAQAIQAIAAGEEPSVDMNPILLKPKGNLTSSLIINGKWVGDYSVNSYYGEVVKKGLQIASDAIKRIGERDFLVIEGAGSPAEINLYDKDIANMRTAELAKAPVIIVGDIERGGVFASLYGTYFLLPEKWRAYVKGFIINKMGGDPSLLGNGPMKLTSLTGVPVLGVVPYETDLDTPWEDSLDIRTWGKGPISVAVIRYPGASILTDIEPLRYEADITLNFVEKADQLDNPDVIILPGSKAARSDLKWMKQVGLDSRIKALAKEGITVVGICGGAQIMGKKLEDPLGYEGEEPGADEGMGLLPHTTVFSGKKTVKRTRVEDPFGGRVVGFEIHKGLINWAPDWETGRPLFKADDGIAEGFYDGKIFATLIHHSIFYDGALRKKILGEVRKLKGIPDPQEKNPADELMNSIQKAEDLLRRSVNIKEIIRIAEEGIPRRS